MARAQLPNRLVMARLGLFACLMGTLAGLPQDAAAKERQQSRKPDDRRQVMELEETWRMAQLNADTATMDRLLSEDYVGITMNGQVVTKMQQLERIRSRQFSVTKIELSDVKVKLISNTAIVTSEANVEGTSEGAPLHGTYRYTRVYTKLPSGAWKITNFEATRVGPPAGGGRGHRGAGPVDSSQ